MLKFKSNLISSEEVDKMKPQKRRILEVNYLIEQLIGNNE